MTPDATRREVLSTLVVSAGAGALAGCNSGPPDRPGATLPDLDDLPAVDGERDPGFPQGVASGDPRPSSVVLWTRYAPAADADRTLRVQVARNAAFEERVVDEPVAARATDGGCVRVKVVDLAPDAAYRYRFVAPGGTSPVGRTRTAPSPDDGRRVAVGVASCQDYVGRYYNAYLPLLARDDLDAVVHLGDYVYETTGDPATRRAAGDRTVAFDDAGAAIDLPAAGGTERAARSLSNYRDLYRTYRSDPVLRRVHRRYPVVQVWDDHEFSDDAWGAHATYTGGRDDEASPGRRRNAERAFFEYAPVDPLDAGGGRLTPGAGFPDTRLYRDLRFGRHLHLLLTDYRTFRGDHVVPEDAFPGTVVMARDDVVDAIAASIRTDGFYAAAASVAALAGEVWTGVDLSALPAGGARAAARAAYDRVAGSLRPYADLDAAAYRDHRGALRSTLAEAYRAAGVGPDEAERRATDAAGGRVDAVVADRHLREAGAFGGGLAPIATDDLPRGISYALFGKRSLFGSIGSRYFVVKPTFDLYATYRRHVEGSVPSAFGADQRAWLYGADGSDANTETEPGTGPESSVPGAGPGDRPGALAGRAPDATWKALCSSVSPTSMVLDLADPPETVAETAADLPAQLRTRFYLNVDQWDGFPAARETLLSALSSRPGDGGAVALAGDVHAAFAADHGTADAGDRRVAAFTGPAVSSGTLRSLVRGSVGAAGLDDVEGIPALIDHLDAFLRSGSDEVAMAESGRNGAMVVEAGPAALSATYYLLSPEVVRTAYYDRPGALAEYLTVRRFRFDGETLRETT